MSRTDAHTPYWVWATWYEPSHDTMCEHYIPRGNYHIHHNEPCDLPKRPVRHANARIRHPRPVTKRPCTWEPVWPGREVRWMRGYKWGVAPRWFVRHVWSGPERVRERVELGRMVHEYNANGELEDGDFANYRHRHCAWWLWD
jgi:hypothetical protein